MASSHATEQTSAPRQEMRQRREPPFKFLVPLIYAPILPLIRIGFKRQPVLRDRLFGGVLAFGLLHGGYLVYPRVQFVNVASSSTLANACGQT